MTTAPQLQALRKTLNWSLSEMCTELGLSGKHATQSLREMENGIRRITGPISKLAGRIALENGITL